MARIRTIKPEFPQSESMGRVSREARLCFVLLWTIADDEGRLRGNSRMLASLLFPYDDDAPGLMDGWISELEQEGCVNRYQVEGSTYIEIAKWLSHQKIDKPSKSKIPPFDESSRILANVRESSPLDQGSKDQGSKDQEEAPSAGRSRSLSVSDLVKAGIPEPVARDWLAVRKAKKQPLTETAFDAVKRESVKAGMELSAAILVCAERGWVGFKAEWLTQARQSAPNGQTQAGQGGGSQAPIVGPQIAQTRTYLAAQTITETDRAAAIAAAQALRATRQQMAQ